MATSIYVVGAPRSGTTWLSAILASHTDVASVRTGSAKDSPPMESFYFSHMAGSCGDLAHEQNRERFIHLLSETDFFKKANVLTGELPDIASLTYVTVFKTLMDRVAQRESKGFWLEKTPAHAFHLDEIAPGDPSARFIAVNRNVSDQIKSVMNLPRRLFPEKFKKRDTPLIRKILIVKRVISHAAYHRLIKSFDEANPGRILIIDYDDLVRDHEAVIRRVCRFIGIPFETELLRKRQHSNSSFASDGERSNVLTPLEETMIQLMASLVAFMPDSLFFAWRRAKRYYLERSIPRLLLPLFDKFIPYGPPGS